MRFLSALTLVLLVGGVTVAPLQAQLRTASAPSSVRAGLEDAPVSTQGASGDPYRPSALPCSINTACREATGWDDEVGATVRIVRGGVSCTGVLLNNTRQDRTPYVLTAHHCGQPAEGQVLDWVFQFNYQSPTCADPSETPVPVSLSGAVVRAADATGDFALLELLEPIPVDVSFAGWSIEDRVPARGTVIGHPQGDIKKIALDDDRLQDLRTYWYGTFDRGTIEIGSSGAPLFDEEGFVVGIVHSAAVIDHEACSGPGGDDNRAAILFPKLSHLWDEGTPGRRLGDFLDPEGGTTRLAPLGPPPPIWIHEIDADTRPGNAPEFDEFVELAGRPGARLDGYQLFVYSCADGYITLRSIHHLDAFTFADEHRGRGFFVLGGDGLDPAVRDQLLPQRRSGPISGSAHGVLPDGSGLLVLRDADRREAFHYQYDAGRKNGRRGREAGPACPPAYRTRSAGDAPGGSGTMGFLATEAPSPAEDGTATLRATPGQPNVSGSDWPTASKRGAEAPEAFTVEPVYPNPFNPQAQFRFAVGAPQRVEATLYDVLGRRVRVLYAGVPAAGQMQTVRIDGSGLPSGLYVVRLAGATFVETQTVTLAK